MERIGELRSKPALRTLALRGVSYDEPAKRLFHTEGRAALSRLAEALTLDAGSSEIRSNKAGPAVSGQVTIHAESPWVQPSLGSFCPGREHCFPRSPGTGTPTRACTSFGPLHELLPTDPHPAH